MKKLLLLVMCLCLAGCQVAESHREASFDDSDRIGYPLWSGVPDVKWPSMFDFDPRETSLSYSPAWDPEPTHHTGLLGSYLPYGNDSAEGLSCSIPWDPTDSNVLGHYLSYAANDKMTIDYKLWENVVSGVEYLPADTELDDSADPCPPFWWGWPFLY